MVDLPNGAGIYRRKRDGRRMLYGLALAAGTLLGANAGAYAAETPAQHCRRVGADDALRPIPALLVPAAKRLFGLDAPDSVVQRSTVFRCLDGAVLICTSGANLPCGKANEDRHLASAGRYCRENPDASSIPMFVTGHDTIYAWRCRGAEADAGEPAEPLDPRGFMARLWKPAG